LLAPATPDSRWTFLAFLLTLAWPGTGEPLVFAAVLWSLAVLLAGLGLYSAWAMLGGTM
jgi:hypothetical protein